ncbi:MAG: hypothetical protein R3D88_04505 [Alphaproteobacteria bacterium]|nr:hypothetical protein [Alphaproteobacteria bacterium]
MQIPDNDILISLTALIVSIIALIYTVKTFWLKKGQNIRASFTTTNSIACEDEFISSLTLENLKDRSVIIFWVYLRIGHNYYIEIEDFEEAPLILKPFEVYKKEYDPIDFYSVNMRRIRMNQLFKDQKAKRQIILSTSEGKYVVKSWIKHWNPTYDFFRNHMTTTILPMRSLYKGKAYGENVKYIIDLKIKKGREEIIPIYPREYEFKWAQELGITKDSLESKDSLETILREKIKSGILGCEDIEVLDIESWRNKKYSEKYENIISAKYYSWFYYKVIGRLATLLDDYKLKRENKKARKKKMAKKDIA